MQGLEPVECKATRDRNINGRKKQVYYEEELSDLEPLYRFRDIVSAPF